MQLLIDSSDPREIAQAHAWGIIDGVTTNPTLIAKAGPDRLATLKNVLDASPGVVFCQVIGWKELDPLKTQARWLHRFSERIVAKLPMSVSGIMAVRQLKQEVPDIRLAVTTVSSVAQAYLCGKAGADVVALFNGPFDLESDQPVDLVTPVRRIYDRYGFKTKILSAGRFPRAFGEYAVAGTDYCTLRFEYLKLLFEHAYTDKRMNNFSKDWRTAFGDQTWPQS
ncbi:MAG: hypothetical protein M1608_07735 [Candidatus Omnitrophica bacterium]|nr:hypothetical protein [Candidatus Omnitrophota bacterium]